MFAGNYMDLKKNGTFGWSKLTYVGEVKKREDEASYPSFGLMAPGYLWVDDVSVEKVGDDAALTPEPVIGAEEKPVAPPADPGAARRPLPRLRLPQQSVVGTLLRLRRGAGDRQDRSRGAAGQDHYLL